MKDPRRPTVREIVRSDDPALAGAYHLLRRTFPRSELVRQAEWRSSLQEREADLWTDLRWHLVIAETAGRVVGLATGTYLGNVNTGVIGYVAVSPSARGQGIGPKLRASLRGDFRRDARQILGRPLKAIVGEVRRDNPWLLSLIRHDHVLALDFPYLQPRLRRSERLVPLVFYYESLDRVRRSLTATTVRRLLYTIWRRIYRIHRPLAEPAFRKMLTALSIRHSIGEVRLASLSTMPRHH